MEETDGTLARMSLAGRATQGAAVAAVALATLWLPSCDRGPATPAPSPQAPASPEREAARPTHLRLLLVGLDGADWQRVRALASAGHLPHLRALLERGASGSLVSEEPMLSPILWTTLATGRGPLSHGVLDFVEEDPQTGEPVPVSARQRRVPALWDVFAAAGLEATVVGWWATWPAYPLPGGRMVSDRVAFSAFRWDPDSPAPAGLFHPAALGARLLPLQVLPADLGPDEMSGLTAADAAQWERAERALEQDASAFDLPLNHLRQVVASMLTYHRMALALLQDHQPALFAVYYAAIDEVSHLFAHCRSPALPTCPPVMAAVFGDSVDGIYRSQDELLGELVAAAGTDTVVVVVSDHGFFTGAGRPQHAAPGRGGGRAAQWHRREGILALAGPPIVAGPLAPHGLRDLAPTLLYLAGLPLADELEGQPLLDALQPTFVEQHPVRRIPVYSPWEPLAATLRTTQDDPAAAEGLRKLAALGYLSTGSAHGGSSAKLPAIRRLVTEAFLLEQEGSVEAARNRLRRALDLDPDYGPTQLGLAALHQRQGDLLEALRLFEAALDHAWATQPRAYPAAARCYVDAGQAARGLQRFLTLAGEHSGVLPLQVGLALLQRANGQATEGEATLRAVLRQEPASRDAMEALYDLLLAAGRLPEAIPLLQRALEANPLSAAHHRWLGRIATYRGRTAEATLHFARATEVAPDQVGPLLDLAGVLAQSGRLREARQLLVTASERFPREPLGPERLGRLLLAGGDTGEARRVFQEAERRGMRTAALFRTLGSLATGLHRVEEARRYYQWSLDLQPDQPRVRQELQALGS